MGKLHRKVIRVLRERFKVVEHSLQEIPPTGYVTGVIVSPAFHRLDFSQRQDRLKNLLQRKLTRAEYDNVGPIATLTPAEARVKAI